MNQVWLEPNKDKLWSVTMVNRSLETAVINTSNNINTLTQRHKYKKNQHQYRIIQLYMTFLCRRADLAAPVLCFSEALFLASLKPQHGLWCLDPSFTTVLIRENVVSQEYQITKWNHTDNLENFLGSCCWCRIFPEIQIPLKKDAKQNKERCFTEGV